MSTLDSPAWRPPPTTDQLISTVRAPAAALCRADGQIRHGDIDGLFVADLRVLTEARLSFDGTDPHHLAHQHEGPGRTRFVSVARNLGDESSDPTVSVHRTRELTSDGMSERIRISSAATEPVRTTVAVDLRCDLTPLDAARRGVAQPDLIAVAAATTITWRRDDVVVRAAASGPAAAASATPARFTWVIDLLPGKTSTIEWEVRASEPRRILVAPDGPVEWSRPRVACEDSRFTRLLAQSLDDLESLRLSDSTAPEAAGRALPATFLGAGAPWFLTLFGRDSIWAARMLLPLGTALAEGTLRVLARRQGTVLDPVSGEAPGKIMHELRHDDPRLDRTVQVGDHKLPATYYGTIDATLLWISLLAEAWRWGMPESTVASFLPHLTRALEWLERHADADGDGFVEYIDTAGRGLANQGWKDSGDAVRFRDGTQGRPPIALCEVQGYAHRAALDAADVLDALTPAGFADAPSRWREYAAGLATRFRERFWVDGPLGPYPALAIDGDGRPVDSLTSNIGHLLGTGLLTAAEESAVARVLGTEPLSGAYGLRTMSTLDAGFNPLSYHCGSVWPHDTAIAIAGIAAAGAGTQAVGLIESLLTAAESFSFRLPELYGGHARSEVTRPLPYPAACAPQAWAAAAAITVLQTVVGLSADVPRGEVRIRPLAGHRLGVLSITGLRVAGAAVDVSVDRDGTVRVSGLPPFLRLITEATPRPVAGDSTGAPPHVRPATPQRPEDVVPHQP